MMITFIDINSTSIGSYYIVRKQSLILQFKYFKHKNYNHFEYSITNLYIARYIRVYEYISGRKIISIRKYHILNITKLFEIL